MYTSNHRNNTCLSEEREKKEEVYFNSVGYDPIFYILSGIYSNLQGTMYTLIAVLYFGKKTDAFP